MLFKATFKQLIRDGKLTLTFRTWKTVKVVVGNSYRLGPDDAIVVTALDLVTLDSITAAQARRAGFAGVDELAAFIRASAKGRLTSRSKLFRVAFRHEVQADPRAARRQETSAAALAEIEGRLERMDRLSRRGPWTTDALQLIADRPQVVASKLAPRMGRETRAFKADIRKLKEMGLTMSHEVGYSLSPRGRALLRRLRRTGQLIALAVLTLVLAGTWPASAEVREPDTFHWNADFRVRMEHDFDSATAAGTERDDRLRLRVRARVGLSYVRSNTTFGVRLRSGSDLSHQSPHITVLDFDDNDTGDAEFNLDRWYVSQSLGSAGVASIGRDVQPFWQQNEMLFDADATLAGVSVSWAASAPGGSLFLNGGYFSLPVGMKRFAGNLGGAQAVYTVTSGAVRLALGLYDFDADPTDLDAATLLNGNGMRNYSILQLSGQVKLRQHDKRPITVGVDLLRNAESYSPSDPDPFTAANHDQTDGLVVSVAYGSTGERGRRLVGYQYARIETLAVNASYAEDDWVRWGSAVETRGSDMKGHELRFGYGLSEQAHVLVRLYVAEAITTSEDGSRARVDLNYRF